MSKVRFHYNPRTCRYEPAGISLWKLTGNTLLLLFCTTLLFSGMLWLHNLLFESENSKALRRENNALKTHYLIVENKLNGVNTVLADISRKEHELGKKLFGDEENKRNQSAAQLKHEHILQADALGFSEVINSLKEKSHSMNIAYGQSLNYFSEMKVSEKDITFLMGTPSILPVEKTSEFKLASGFGKRINPFHKGSYLHPGVDFAAARGTAVVATGNGRVITAIHNSSIQAGYGNYIEIEHSNGIISRYSHLEDVKVKPGQKVTKGLVIGIIGMSGGTIAPHVHYEIIRKGKEVDPIPYMLEALSVSEHHELWQAGTKRNQSMD